MITAIRARAQGIFISSSDRRPAFHALLEDLLELLDLPCGAIQERPLLASDEAEPWATVAWHCRVPGEHEHHAPSDEPPSLAIEHEGDEIGRLLLAGDPSSLSYEQREALRQAGELIGQLLEVWRVARFRRHAQRSIARLSQVAQQMRQGMCITNASGVIDWANPALARMVGVDPTMLVGVSPQHALREHTGIEGDVLALVAALESGSAHRADFRIAAAQPDVEDNWVEVQTHPVLEAGGTPAGLVITVDDIGERRRVERMKQDFVSTISHELRTPLTSIAGALALLEAHAASGLDPDAQELLAIARRNSTRLTRLVDDLLDLDKLAAGRLRIDIERCDANAMAREARLEHQVFADAYGVGIALRLAPETGERPWVEADPARLQQVLRNLLSNAVKASAAGGGVTVSVETEARTVAISVQDAGHGIPWEVQPRIFQRFTQADTANRTGTGLGLAISRELVHQMCGSLTFASVPGEGSCFTVRLPRLQEGA